MIELINVRKVFNAGNPSEFSAINTVNLHIAENKITVLKGPSGSGKTTLLSIVGCMSRPTAGRVKLNEREITSLPERFLTEIRRKTFGFIFQQPNLIKGISVLDNVMIVRALINNPSIIIADEPTAHLDTKLSYRFMEIVEKFKADGKTVIITSHDPLVYDSAMVDCVVNLRDGKIEDAPP
ncbi:MAG: ATP-binding cassette domain-containing protein [Methylococcaceae bacterium]|nr:ATP-binding cassette domain-containing protein [Methylococcaceae bacterium]